MCILAPYTHLISLTLLPPKILNDKQFAETTSIALPFRAQSAEYQSIKARDAQITDIAFTQIFKKFNLDAYVAPTPYGAGSLSAKAGYPSKQFVITLITLEQTNVACTHTIIHLHQIYRSTKEV